MQPVRVEVELVPPPGVGATAMVNAVVLDPEGTRYWLSDLTPQGGNLYAGEEPLHLPLDPPEGDWQLSVGIRSTLDVEGEQVLVFQPAPIHFHDLADDLPAGVDVRVPQDLAEVSAYGDQWAGGRVWRYGDGELSLWWAPGPIEPLLLNNAIVMLETTHDPDAPPRELDVEEMEWGGHTAFLFLEEWAGSESSPAKALVVQGPDYWLYVLRVRALGGEEIPLLLRQVWETFTFAEG